MWRGLLTVLTVGVLSAGCSVAGSSPPPSASAPAPASASAAPTQATPAAPSADPVSPEPSAATYAPIGSPEPAGTALVVHRAWDDIGPQLDRTVVLADGRVITMVRDDEHPFGLVERRLSSPGLELVLAEVMANPLFERSQWRPLAASPPACCGAGDEIVLLRDGREVTVGRGVLPDWVYAPSAAWDGFERLLGRLDALESWLPADAWVQREPRPYAAAAYRLSIGPAESGSTSLGSIAWPTGLDPTSFGAPLPADPSTRCDVVDARTALGIAAQADALRAAQGAWRPQPTLAEAGLFDDFLVRAPGDGDPVAVALRALLPHQAAADAAATCAAGW